MTYLFRPPTVELSPADPQGERLWLYFRMNVGITILKHSDGSFTQHQFVSQDDMREAAACYLGGHEYDLELDDAIALWNAGFTDFTPLPDVPLLDPPGFGQGAFGDGGFGT